MSRFFRGRVGKICSQIFTFLRKKVVNITFSDLRPVSNETTGNFTHYRGIFEFLNLSIFVKIQFVLRYSYVRAIKVLNLLMKTPRHTLDFYMTRCYE